MVQPTSVTLVTQKEFQVSDSSFKKLTRNVSGRQMRPQASGKATNGLPSTSRHNTKVPAERRLPRSQIGPRSRARTAPDRPRNGIRSRKSNRKRAVRRSQSGYIRNPVGKWGIRDVSWTSFLRAQNVVAPAEQPGQEEIRYCPCSVAIARG